MNAAYNAWANARLVAFLRETPHDPRIEAILGHLAVAGETWLARLEGDRPPTPDLWPALSFDESAERLAAVDTRLSESRDLAPQILYRNSTGAEFSNSVAEILAHVLNHATYHRGEIAGLLLATGIEPPLTDLILHLRS